MTQHTLDWGIIVSEPAPDDWQQWPHPWRAMCARAFELAEAFLREKYGPVEVVSDESACRPRDDARLQLYRKMVVRVL